MMCWRRCAASCSSQRCSPAGECWWLQRMEAKRLHTCRWLQRMEAKRRMCSVQPCVAVPNLLSPTGCRCRPRRRYAPPPRHVALACRRLRAAANSPAVLHTLTASAGSADDFSGDTVMRTLRSLCHFVVHVAAPHMQRLKLGLWPADEMESADWLEAGMLLASLLQACSGLEVLEMSAKAGFILTLSGWMGGLTSLRRLVRSCAAGDTLLLGGCCA